MRVNTLSCDVVLVIHRTIVFMSSKPAKSAVELTSASSLVLVIAVE